MKKEVGLAHLTRVQHIPRPTHFRYYGCKLPISRTLDVKAVGYDCD